MNAEALIWPHDSICLRPPSLDAPSIAADIYDRVRRTDFDALGFCVLNVGHSIDSVACCQLMVDLKWKMAVIHESKTEKNLIYLSAT